MFSSSSACLVVMFVTKCSSQLGFTVTCFFCWYKTNPQSGHVWAEETPQGCREEVSHQDLSIGVHSKQIAAGPEGKMAAKSKTRRSFFFWQPLNVRTLSCWGGIMRGMQGVCLVDEFLHGQILRVLSSGKSLVFSVDYVSRFLQHFCENEAACCCWTQTVSVGTRLVHGVFLSNVVSDYRKKHKSPITKSQTVIKSVHYWYFPDFESLEADVL